MKYRSEIDGLRAFAVVPVILFHAGFELFSGGFVGVDIFFVISGYLITTILIEDIENQRFSVASFYERRARRILPALFAVMLLCIPFAWMWMLPIQMEDFAQSLIAVSFSVSNILFWKETGYFDLASEEKPLLHTWSLAVEEQYYFLFPFLLIFLWRFGRNRAMWGVTVVALGSLILSEWGWRNKPDANFFLVISRAWELLLGSIAAFVVQRSGVQKNNLLSLFGFFAILISIFVYDESVPFPSVYGLLPVLGTVFIILYADSDTYVAKVLKNKLFVGIGLISYSAYLWHQPLFAYARILHIEHLSEVVFLTLSAVSFVLAAASYKYIERPFRNKNFLTRKQVLVFSLVPITAFSLFGVVGAQTQGFKNYITTTYQREFLASAIESPKRDECHTGGKNFKTYDQSCEYLGKDVEVAVLGDSHAVELSYALATLLQKSEVGVKHLSFSSCIPSYQIRLKGSVMCSEWTNKVVRDLIEDERIKTVVLSYRIAAALYGKHEKHYPSLIDQKSIKDRQKIWGSLLSLSKELNRAGKKVIYVLQAPELPRLIGYLIPGEASLAKPKGVSRAWWDERMSYVYEHLDDLSKVATIVDPADDFCDLESCYVGSTNKAYYFDDDHMSVAGASVIAEHVLKHIENN